jgi:hypothetical protein
LGHCAINVGDNAATSTAIPANVVKVLGVIGGIIVDQGALG